MLGEKGTADAITSLCVGARVGVRGRGRRAVDDTRSGGAGGGAERPRHRDSAQPTPHTHATAAHTTPASPLPSDGDPRTNC